MSVQAQSILSDEDKQFFKLKFSQSDQEGNNYLDKNEFKILFQKIIAEKLTEEQINQGYKEINTNNDDKITFEEFIAYLEKIQNMLDNESQEIQKIEKQSEKDIILKQQQIQQVQTVVQTQPQNPVQLFALSAQVITPLNFYGIKGFDDPDKFLFCWRWFERKNEKFRFVTLEEPKQKYEKKLQFTITPLDLCSVSDYRQGLSNKTGFNWRWMSRNQEKFRVVTLEEGSSVVAPQFENRITPYDLWGINDYEKDITKYFGWKKLKVDNGTTYYTLTIENYY